MRGTEKRGRASYGWSGTSSACSKISPTISRCCVRSSIAAPEGRSGCRCRAGVMNVFQRRSSRRCPSVTNLQTEEAARLPRKAPLGNHPREAPRHSRSRRPVRRRRRRPREIRFRPPVKVPRLGTGSPTPTSRRRPGRSTRWLGVGDRRATVCSCSSSRGLSMWNSPGWWTPPSGSMMPIQRSGARLHRGLSATTPRSPWRSRWRRWRSRRVTSTRSSRNSWHTGAAHRPQSVRPGGGGRGRPRK